MTTDTEARLKWRDVLTPEERETIEAGDRAKAEWDRLSASRPKIVNRAVHRARYRNAAILAAQEGGQ